MHFSALRALFELLCEQFEKDAQQQHVPFQGGYGIEMPEGVVMVFLVGQQVYIYRFEVVDADEYELDKSMVMDWEEDTLLDVDTCLEMVTTVQNWDKGFQELFC